MNRDVTIIIITRNRSNDLKTTLDHLRSISVPDDKKAELLVVDNGSADNTAQVVRDLVPFPIPVRYVYEGRAGKSHGYNRALAEASGEILLWTDDDVRPPENWIAGMYAPILAGKAQAVAGGVRLAPHLERPWMQKEHRNSFASTDGFDAEKPSQMIGANMAFSREVLSRVPAFDTELGPGALGFCDESLFSWQLLKAGYTIASAFNIEVEHHFDPARLTRANLIASAQKSGRCNAYIAHHWEHEQIDVSLKRLYQLWRYLRSVQGNRDGDFTDGEGIRLAEIHAITEFARSKQYIRERKRPRNYEKFGLVKRAHV